MKSKTRLLSCILVMIMIFASIQVYAKEITAAQSLRGVVYQNNKITAVKDKKDMNAAQQLRTIQGESGLLSIVGTLLYNGKSYNVNTSGKIYPSNALYLRNNATTVIFEPSKDIEFLSCIIEKNADKEMLLPVNRDILNGLTVIKIAMRNTATNEIVYIEDLFPKTANFEFIYAQCSKTEPDVVENLSLQENWYLPYLQLNTVQEDSEEVAAGLDYITNILKESNVYEVNSNNNVLNNGRPSMMAVSPVPGVPADAFKIEGRYYYNSSEAYGYYRITYEYPYGTGCYNTQLIKWNTITNAPVPGGAHGVSNLCIEVEATYRYYQSSDIIELFDNNSNLKIKNPTVQLSLLTGNSDIITRVEKNITCNGSSVSINWKSWIGLLPFGSTFLKYYNLATSVQFIQESITSNVLTFYDRISDSLAAWGKVHRDYKLDLPSNKELKVEGDKVELSVGIKKPTDSDSYYTYVTGAKSAAYQFDFDIYSGSSTYEYTISKDIYRTYY